MPDSDQVQRAYRQLLAEITDWTLPPGQTLAEVDLSKRLAVSRTPLREALRRLRREGLVEQEPGQSARVTPVSVEGAVALFQVREALEMYAVRLAARAPERAPFARFAEEFQALAAEAAPDTDAIYQLSRRFDDAVIGAAGNQYFTTLLDELYVQLARLRRLSHDNPDRLRATATQHVEIAEAISRGDGTAAARAQATRLKDGLDSILDALSGKLLGPE